MQIPWLFPIFIFSLTFNKIPWLLPSLEFPWLFPDRWTPCWWMTLKNNRASLLYHVKLCASFQSHLWIQTGVTVRKRSIRVKTGDFFVLCDLEIWQMTLKDNRALLICYFKLCALFNSHHWIQTGVTVWNTQFGSKSMIFLAAWPWNLTDDIEKQ